MRGEPPCEKTAVAPAFVCDEGRDDAAVAARLAAEVAAQFGPREEAPFSIRALGPDGGLLGGVNGAAHWRWLYVRNLWVDAGARGQGLGRRLLQEAENFARARGCAGVYLDTFDPGAAAFYERCGFVRFGVLDDFPPGHRRTYLCKRLDADRDGFRNREGSDA
jgi:GNAT superfamily N-acetyltransferase